MLVLTRKLGETIVIGDAVRITVVAISGGQIRLGIEAPAAVKVLREELRHARHPGGSPGTSGVRGSASPLRDRSDVC